MTNSAKVWPTRDASIARLALAMHPNVPLPPLASGTAVRVVAALGLRVHRWSPLDVSWQSGVITSDRMPEGPAFFQAATSLTTVKWGGTVAA